MDKTTLSQLKQLKKKLKQKASPAAVQIKPLRDDRALLKEAMQGVQPLKGSNHYAHPQSDLSPWPRKCTTQHLSVTDDMSDFWPWDELEQGEQLLFVKAGLRLDTLRKLKRGDWPVDAELDLHGENTDSARIKVVQFLAVAVEKNCRCIRIIHGKGLSSKEGLPVLKLKLKNWLAQRNEVLAFAQANAMQGSAGAVLVLLKSGRKR